MCTNIETKVQGKTLQSKLILYFCRRWNFSQFLLHDQLFCCAVRFSSVLFFSFLSFSSLFYLCFFPWWMILFHCSQLLSFILSVMIGFTIFYPSIAFGSLWVFFLDCPLACCLPSYYHCTMLVAPRFIPRQKWLVLSCLLPLFVFTTLIWIKVKPLPHLYLWHASSGFSSYLFLLGEMPS